MGVIKGDTRSLDYSTCRVLLEELQFLDLGFGCTVLLVRVIALAAVDRALSLKA